MLSPCIPAELFYGIAQKDAGRVIVALQALGIIVAQGDTLSLKRAITYFLKNIARQVRSHGCALELCRAASCYRMLWPVQHKHMVPAGSTCPHQNRGTSSRVCLADPGAGDHWSHRGGHLCSCS